MTNERSVKEPLFHIVRRESLPLWKKLSIYAGAILIALFLVGVFCAVSSSRHKTPFDMFSSTFNGVFGSERRIWIYFRAAMLLLGVSLALLPAFKMKFWNLGANGQIVISALVCYAFMNWGNNTGASNAVVVIFMIAGGLLAGIIWAVVPALFKAFFRTNETLFTLMMNYIAQGLVTVMITVWASKGSGSLPSINRYGLPNIGGKSYLLSIIVVAVITVFMYFYTTKSKHGYELSLVGESENTARYAGINVKKILIRTLVLSGAICGIVGILLAGSINHNVSTTAHSNMGFTAIMTVWLADFNPLATIGTCFLITFISTGMGQVKQDFGFTNDALTNVALGVTYFLIIACFFFINYRVIFRKKQKSEESREVSAEGGKS